MKFLLGIIIGQLIGLTWSLAKAADITVVNQTGADMRIAHFGNKCQGFIVPEDKPIRIKFGKSHTFKNVSPVVQTYNICGSGFCSASAMGMKDSQSYNLIVTLDNGMITGNAKPDHWVGNLECPNEKK